MNDLVRLVYVSRNHIDADGGDAMAAAIRQILAASQRNNVRDGITGALMFNRGCFAQVLEGPGPAVEAAFERIQQDIRHGDVTLLDMAPVAARGFPNWSMAFVGGQADGVARFGAIGGESGFDPERMTGEGIFEALTRLVVEDEAA